MTATKAAVLIVEDDPASLDVIVRLLRKNDFEPDVAASAGEALLKLEADELPAAVILDLRLPDANGGIVLRNIRRHQLPIRVAVVTGVSDPSIFTDLMKFPPDAVFKKPVDHRELLRWLTGTVRE